MWVVMLDVRKKRWPRRYDQGPRVRNTGGSVSGREEKKSRLGVHTWDPCRVVVPFNPNNEDSFNQHS
jgi:hypothetical protein